MQGQLYYYDKKWKSKECSVDNGVLSIGIDSKKPKQIQLIGSTIFIIPDVYKKRPYCFAIQKGKKEYYFSVDDEKEIVNWFIPFKKVEDVEFQDNRVMKCWLVGFFDF